MWVCGMAACSREEGRFCWKMVSVSISRGKSLGVRCVLRASVVGVGTTLKENRMRRRVGLAYPTDGSDGPHPWWDTPPHATS